MWVADMTILKREKKYKDVSPEETVNRIRNLLDQYGIEISEKFFHIDTGDINSCRICISNSNIAELNIGTNGKGMDINYTRASAYGEFMERLANNMLLPKVTTNTEKLKLLEEEEARPYYQRYFREVFGINNKFEQYVEQRGEKVTMLEVEDVFNGTVTYLPIDYVETLCSSNGMCAGNTKEEALLQGISEIFERYAQYEIMMNNLTPPEIDRDFFASTGVKERLDELEKEGYKYRILDCSLGKGYPVIGLELVFKGKYRIRLGSDPSPITALERCFTEIFQGHNVISEDLFVDIEDTRRERAAFKGSDEAFRFTQYQLETINGSGCYPEENVGGNAKPSYEFSGFEHPISYSNEDDLNYYFDIIRRNGKHLYIADRSNMGFPVYFAVVPSLSEISIADDGTYYVNKLKNFISSEAMSRIPFMNREELLELAEKLEIWYANYGAHWRNISSYFPPGLFASYHKYKMLSFLYACGGNEEKAAEYLDRFLETTEGKYEPRLLNRRLVKEGKPEDCFPIDKWPICPKCDECRAASECRLKEVRLFNEQIVARIQSFSIVK